MLGPAKPRRVDQPVVASLDALVPADHFYRHLERALDLAFVRELVRDTYAAGGRPSIDPVVFFKLQLILFFEGIRSERQLIETASLNLAHRWYLGYALDEELPDHSSLTRIRTRLGVDVFQRFFERVVELCQEAGLVWGKELLADATKVCANAAVDSLVPRWYQRAEGHAGVLFASGPEPLQAAAATSQAGPAPGVRDAPVEPPVPLPFAGTTAERERLATSNRATWKLLEQRRLDPERSPTGGYRRTAGRLVSLTDPDATPMRAHNGDRLRLGYHDHYLVDGGKARIILGVLVTPADVMENTPLPDLLWRARFRWHLHPRRVVGDTTYGTLDNIRLVEDAGVRAYFPLPDWDRTPYYGPSRFAYDAGRDEYRCPQGQPLRRYTAKYEAEATVYRADPATCNACPLRAACTDSERGRTLQRSFWAEYLERVRGYHQTAAFRRAMRKRSAWVEPLFGEAKEWHGLRRFRLRGLEKVNMEGLWVATGQNLKRWLAAEGWGRRQAPCGGLLSRPRHRSDRLPSRP
jgi:transposase